MSNSHNTLFLRLTGPMQSWGTSSRVQLRRTGLYPSKSGVMGILLCSMGIRREKSSEALEQLTSLFMGVRIDKSGTPDWDYHTVGAKTGIISADNKIKVTYKTGEYETLLSRRQYLYDASFLIALQGEPTIIEACAEALQCPVWPLFLGRKCCIPSEPVYAGTGYYASLEDALAAIPWQSADWYWKEPEKTLEAYIEQPPGLTESSDGELVYDVPVVFGAWGYKPRLNAKRIITAPVKQKEYMTRQNQDWKSPYSSHFINVARPRRLEYDNYLCVFCKSPAEQVHHVSYENAGHETNSDLRSLCRLCHDACTMLEYSRGRTTRIDPSDPAQRPAILEQINRIVTESQPGKKRKLLQSARSAD